MALSWTPYIILMLLTASASATPPACFISCLNEYSRWCPLNHHDLGCLENNSAVLIGCFQMKCSNHDIFYAARDHFLGTLIELKNLSNAPPKKHKPPKYGYRTKEPFIVLDEPSTSETDEEQVAEIESDLMTNSTIEPPDNSVVIEVDELVFPEADIPSEVDFKKAEAAATEFASEFGFNKQLNAPTKPLMKTNNKLVGTEEKDDDENDLELYEEKNNEQLAAAIPNFKSQFHPVFTKFSKKKKNSINKGLAFTTKQNVNNKVFSSFGKG